MILPSTQRIPVCHPAPFAVLDVLQRKILAKAVRIFLKFSAFSFVTRMWIVNSEKMAGGRRIWMTNQPNGTRHPGLFGLPELHLFRLPLEMLTHRDRHAVRVFRVNQKALGNQELARISSNLVALKRWILATSPPRSRLFNYIQSPLLLAIRGLYFIYNAAHILRKFCVLTSIKGLVR
jgi:uncharacterized membrane protein